MTHSLVPALPWRVAASVVITCAALVPSSGTDGGPSPQSWVLAVLVAAGIWVTWSEPSRIAWLAGLLLPIQAIDGTTPVGLEVTSICVLGLTVLRHQPTLGGPVRNLLTWFLCGTAVMLVLQSVFGLVRDPLLPTTRYILISAAALAVAAAFAYRVGAYRPLLMGLLVGSTVSALVVLAQASGWELLREAAHGRDRYPGLAPQAPSVAWHMAVAMIVAIYAIFTARRPWGRYTSAGSLIICAVALVVCGAQGALLGLAFASGVCVAFAWNQVDHGVLARTVGLFLACGLVVVGVATTTGLGASSVAGVVGDPDKGYVNELARARAVKYGIDQLIDSPITGVGFDAYDARYNVRPHILPLGLSVNTGILGLVVGASLLGILGWAVLRGPADRSSPSCWLGIGVLAVLFTLTCLTPTGPFAGVERLTVLFAAFVMARGGAVMVGGGHDAVERPAVDVVDLPSRI